MHSPRSTGAPQLFMSDLTTGFLQRSVSDVRGRRFRVAVVGVLVGAAMAFGCKQGPSEEEKARAAAYQQAEQARAEQEAQQAAERAQAEAEAEKKRLEEEAAVKAKAEKKAADQLRNCCDALGKAGFEGRSMEYMKGADACEAAHKEGKKLEEVVSTLRVAIEKEKLPEECAQ